MPEATAGQRCSGCGTSVRMIDVALADATAMGGGDLRMEITITRVSPTGWRHQWGEVLHHLGELRAAYNEDAVVEFQGLERLSYRFFIACWSLKDWLANDSGIQPRNMRSELNEYVKASKPLTICQAYANTAKHLTRSKPSDMQARPGRYSAKLSGSRLSVVYSTAAQNVGAVDSLMLAEQCVEDWKRFLEAHRLTTGG
jgi:hypothetical protein